MVRPFSTNNPGLSGLAVQQAREAVSTELHGKAVILNTATGSYSGLDQVGTTIWKHMERPVSVSDLQAAVMQEYEVSADQCMADLCAFLEDLFSNGLIKIDEDESG